MKPLFTHLATIRWHNSGPDFLKRKYSREHTWHFDGGSTIPASPSPHVVAAPWSNASSVDPEEAFVASVASCHMLWFLHVAIDAGFEVKSYEDKATGEMTRNETGMLWISTIILKPTICWGGTQQPAMDQVSSLHHLAHQQCFIANSIRTHIIINDVL